MFKKQKETICLLEKAMYDSKNFTHDYLVPYKDYLDSTDGFTEFWCERYEGKQKFVLQIEQLLLDDKNAQVFVQVYGHEEYKGDIWIYADTLIILSSLPLPDIEKIFNESDEIFPSDVGKIEEFSEREIIIDKDGNQILASSIHNDNSHIYYCWWD